MLQQLVLIAKPSPGSPSPQQHQIQVQLSISFAHPYIYAKLVGMSPVPFTRCIPYNEGGFKAPIRSHRLQKGAAASEHGMDPAEQPAPNGPSGTSPTTYHLPTTFAGQQHSEEEGDKEQKIEVLYLRCKKEKGWGSNPCDAQRILFF